MTVDGLIEVLQAMSAQGYGMLNVATVDYERGYISVRSVELAEDNDDNEVIALYE